MKKRAKRIYTEEQKAALAERMRVVQKIRWEKKREEKLAHVQGETIEKQAAFQEARIVEENRQPFHKDGTSVVETSVAVLEGPRVDWYGAVPVEQAPCPLYPPGQESVRMSTVDYMIRVRGPLMVSTLGPCVCGAAKREWHKVCLKEQSI